MKDQNMSEWLSLKRLPHNDLPLPKYETEYSAAIDLAACLRRPCQLVQIDGNYLKSMTRRKFITTAQESLTTGRWFFDGDEIPGSRQGPNFPLIIQANETIMVPLGWQCEFGKNYVLKLHVRSSIGLRGLRLANGTGIIDPDYRGELFACLWNSTDMPIFINHGDRIAQGVLLGFSQANIIEAEELEKTERGDAGFGSTGVTTS
jgi:dUTP pyrophosphatase